MSVQVYTPPKKQRESSGGGGILGTIAPIAGAALGFAAGGPGGAMTGLNIGQSVAGLTAQAPDSPTEGARPQTVQTEGNDSMKRRMQSLNENPLKQIGDSINSLQFVQNDQVRQDLAKPLLQAQYLAMNKKQG